MRPAALAFDAAAPGFDRRFGDWLSVAAQRRAVRRVLAAAFPPGGRIFEIGGGTGEDAVWLAERGFYLLVTDPAPAMIELSAKKLADFGGRAQLMSAEDLEQYAERHLANEGAPFDGAFSNFAPLNCVDNLAPVARGLARLLKPGSAAMLVLFGNCAPGEILVECLRGRPTQSLRARWPRRCSGTIGRKGFCCALSSRKRDTLGDAAVVQDRATPRHRNIRASKRGRAVDFPASAFSGSARTSRPACKPSACLVWRSCSLSLRTHGRTGPMSVPNAQFFHEYAHHRAGEGRALRGEELRSLPYLRSGPLARQWAVRARSFKVFVNRVIGEMAAPDCLDVLDLGAGNGWLCHRLAQTGHRAVALDIRDDDMDGLGAARDLQADPRGRFQCVKASFADLPFADKSFDVVIFNASLHYAIELGSVLSEAIRVMRPGGVIAVLDSPCYAREKDGERMVAEKTAQGGAGFGARAEILLTQNFIEFLTPERFKMAHDSLHWSRHRVWYPLWYEVRPLLAWLKRRRRPSRFDVWSARVS